MIKSSLNKKNLTTSFWLIYLSF